MVQKFSKRDNAVMEVGLSVANFLTDELQARPEIDLPMLLASQKVRKGIYERVHWLETSYGCKVIIHAERDPDDRRVFVNLEEVEVKP